jgi:hypothetical protein
LISANQALLPMNAVTMKKAVAIFGFDQVALGTTSQGIYVLVSLAPSRAEQE